METLASRGAGGRSAIDVRNLSKVYASQDGPIQALSDVSFAIADAEFVTIVGHSGCGKSTLLRIIAGLLPPSSGSEEASDDPDRKSTRLNSSHVAISYAVFCLKKKKKTTTVSAR